MNLPSAPRLRLFAVESLAEPVFRYDGDRGADTRVHVIVPLYNYAATIEECLASVVRQDLPNIAVTVIDDASTDDGGVRALAFLRIHAQRFTLAQIVRHERNQGLSMARNSGIVRASEPYVFMLDADNRLRPPALTRLLEAIEVSGAAFAYSQLRTFGDSEGIGVADIWDPTRLRIGNYIDAMALIRRDALLAAAGYAVLADDHGWEDYDLWCRFAAAGLRGVFLPEALCEYRVHGSSMLRSRTNAHFKALMAEMALRHPALFNPES